jgi:hypothetical protein
MVEISIAAMFALRGTQALGKPWCLRSPRLAGKAILSVQHLF